MPTTPPVPSRIDDNDSQSVPNLVADDDSSTDSSLIGFQQESEGEMWADHPNIVPADEPTERPSPEPPPSPAVSPEVPPVTSSFRGYLTDCLLNSQ